MNFIKKNCVSILLVLLTLVMLLTMFSGCKKTKEGYNNIIEGHSSHGSKYLNELQKANDKEIKKIIKGIDSKSAASSELATLQKLTAADTTISAALKSSGGGSSSWFGGDDTDSTSGSDTDDSNSDSSSSDDGWL